MKNTKLLKPAVALVLVAAMAVGGSLAYITNSTDKIDNKFQIATAGKDDSEFLKISLDETFTVDGKKVDATKGETAKFLPGSAIVKSPVVSIEKLDTTVLTEGAYIFVEITDDDDDVMDLGLAMNEKTESNPNGAWTLVPNKTNVYYMEYTDEVTAAKALANVFSDTTITIPTDYSADDFNDVQTLSVQAYAIQVNNIASPEAAWTAVKGA